jgi:diguanylate cyclase (GGDEF)-like protein
VEAARGGGRGAGGILAARRAYALSSLALILVYPFLSGEGRLVVFRVVAFAAIPAVLVGAGRAGVRTLRSPLWVPVLLAGLVIVNVANVVRLLPGTVAETSSGFIDAAGNVVVLAAAVTLVVRCGRTDFGGVIDTAIVALAVGGLIWDFVLLPYEQAHHIPVATEVDQFVVVFALAGVLGALIRVALTTGGRSSALWLIMTALVFAIAGNVVQALAGDSSLRTASAMMFMAAYTGVGLFGLDPAAYRLTGTGPAVRDHLSGRRLLFLGLAIAVLPVAFGLSDLIGGHLKGALLVVAGGVLTALVMIRIRRLSGERDRAEQALRHLATHDPLTGVLNRREFVERLNDEMSRASRSVVVFCDLDGFKAVNDRLGHAAGDELLVEVARRLEAAVRHTDTVARPGGDEFLILLDAAMPGHVDGVLDRISAALSRPINLRGEWVRVGASLGLADSADERDPDELIRRADLAMYRAKRAQPEAPTVRMVGV